MGKKSFLERLWLIITILIIIILISFVWGYNLFGIKTVVTKGVESLKGLSSEVNIEVECPQWIIPSEIDLIKEDRPLIGESGLSGFILSDEQGLEDFIYKWDPKWLDDQEMSMYPPTPEGHAIDFSRSHCVRGSGEGQNINNYYCNLGYSKTTTEISDEGLIGKTNTISYNIKLVLEEKEHIRIVRGYSLDRYKIISSTCMDYLKE